jgi:hypothetical protein
MGRPPQSSGDPGDYIVPFGRSKGQRIRDLPPTENRKSLEWMVANGKTGQYRDALEAWCEGLDANQAAPGDDDVPF